MPIHVAIYCKMTLGTFCGTTSIFVQNAPTVIRFDFHCNVSKIAL